MKKAPYGKKLRREDREKRWAFGLHVQLLVLLVAGCLYLIVSAIHKGVAMAMLPLFIFWLLGFLLLLHDTHKRYRVARETYDPPVNPDTLTADEILVRGSAEPAAQSEVLLRAVQTGQETAAEELLRANVEGGTETA
jgi:hypothetical protein